MLAQFLCYQVLTTGQTIDLSYLCGVSQSAPMTATADEQAFIDGYRLLRPTSAYNDAQIVGDGYRYCNESDMRSPLELSEWLASMEVGSAAAVRETRDHWSAVRFYAPTTLCD